MNKDWSFMSIRAALFRAGRPKYEEVLLAKKSDSCLDALQALVGGNIEIVPHAKASGAQWVAYANEDGMSLDLSSNFVAWGTLSFMGFPGRGTVIPGAYFGNIVLCRAKTKSMSKEDFETLEGAYNKYVAELGEEESSGDEEEAATAAAPKKRKREEDAEPLANKEAKI
jgi:hypothetical protein